MKLVSFDEHRLGVVRGQEVIDVSDLVASPAGDWPPVGMNRLIRRFHGAIAELESTAAARPGRPLSEVRLQTPIPWPNKIIAYPANYHAHAAEMGIVARPPHRQFVQSGLAQHDSARAA